ncbi:hypothetical protein [Agrobacterium tumefaciens]|uniref:hypothetical protein n=1 Tax=Agrobacterium tumefaciens TaxID=358 RepID=UPI0013A6FBE9|nr:hypothetical protein [Agrobacterium tumefaciens]UNZ53587.1 hypothetical protein MLE07_22860 [Agrobacterium tumefaciens]UXT98891.1 hypothetical protein FY129_15275 [Agrobacterium tumefaciens]
MCGSHVSVSGVAHDAAKRARPSENGEGENVSGRRVLGDAMGKDGEVAKNCMSSGRFVGGMRIGFRPHARQIRCHRSAAGNLIGAGRMICVGRRFDDVHVTLIPHPCFAEKANKTEQSCPEC